jgi:hypothetical protein
MDGVLADFAGAFREVEARLFGSKSDVDPEAPEQEEERQERNAPRSLARRDAIWREIENTPDFWTLLGPLDREAIPRIQDLALRLRWEVFFITQRPATAGQTVQRQTQRWLADHGFEFPSVIVLSGSRGRIVRDLEIDYHIDDITQNCLDVMADSTAKTILISPGGKEEPIAGARKLGIAPARNIAEALEILEQATLARENPTLLQRLSALVGWK